MNKITCTNIAKTFVVEGNNIKVLENIDLTIEKGDLGSNFWPIRCRKIHTLAHYCLTGRGFIGKYSL
jgi:hypothetical protein